jgi:nitrite reductase (NO-forming)
MRSVSQTARSAEDRASADAPSRPSPLSTRAGDWDPPIIRRLDAPVDERIDGERTKSNFALMLSGFSVLMAVIAGITIFAVAAGSDNESTVSGRDSGASAPDRPAANPAADDISSAAGKGVEFERYSRPDPTLPAVSPDKVKRFRVEVYEHVTKVSDEFAPMRVWSFGVNGKLNRGTGASEPMVVNEGDRVEVKFVNGGSKARDVRMPHSLDFDSAELAPNKAFATIPPGRSLTFDFVAKHPGVYMYHCVTEPAVYHVGAGMAGMMVVKPAGLAPVDRELWMTQQEYYIAAPGEDPDMAKMEAKRPDVIALNGYADQYQDRPITVARGERVRMYLLNAGPNEWSAFHVIGTVFDRAVTDNGLARNVQTINLAPSQRGYVEFTLDQEGAYPFVTHAFADMEKGAARALTTEGAAGGAVRHD